MRTKKQRDVPRIVMFVALSFVVWFCIALTFWEMDHKRRPWIEIGFGVCGLAISLWKYQWVKRRERG